MNNSSTKNLNNSTKNLNNSTNNLNGQKNNVKNMNSVKNVNNNEAKPEFNINEKISNQTKEITNSVKGLVDDIKETDTNDKVNSFSLSFIQTNTTISKFVFILLIIVIFVSLFHLGLLILQNMYGTKRNPFIVKGIVDSNQLNIYSSNPNVHNSIPIMRSVNELNGIEFTWSVWFYIDDLFLNNNTKYRRIFSKGNSNIQDINSDTYESKFLNNSPGLYLNHNNNIITIVLNTYSKTTDVYETIEIENIPIQNWVNCIITVKNKKVNVFINGILKKSYILNDVLKQNYYDTYVGDKNGFGGHISALKYYDYAINDDYIQYIMNKGPNLSREDNDKLSYNAPYLSLRWYYNNIS